MLSHPHGWTSRGERFLPQPTDPCSDTTMPDPAQWHGRLSASMRRLTALVLLAVLLGPQSLVAWGRVGHQVVAEIAQRRLSPAAQKAVAELLKGATLASISNFGDDYRNNHPETGRWHYVDIPLRAAHYDAARDCQNVPGEGDCIIAEIDRLTVVLRDRSKPEEERAFALKLLVHFVADLHCPLHASDNADRGGNRVGVEFFGRPTNLHAVWDSRLIQQAGYTVTRLTDELETSRLPVTTAGTPVAWAEESHDVARDVAYAIPPDHILGQAYLDAAMPALKLQLLCGGVRLAGLLNAIFDGSATVGPPHTDSTLGGQVKTGQSWTSENRPPRAGDRDRAVLPQAGGLAQATAPLSSGLISH